MTTSKQPWCAIEDDGSFRIRAAPGRNFPSIRSSGQEVWKRTWRMEEFDKGVDVEDGQTLRVMFRVLDQPRP